jgi:pinin
LEEEAEKEREEVAQERRQLFNERRVKQRELHKLEKQVNLFELSQVWQAHGKEMCSGGFIRLKATPAIFYLPKEHNEATQKLVEETQQAITSETEARRKDIEVLIADMEPVAPMEEGKGEIEVGRGGPMGLGSLGPRDGSQEEDILMRNVGEEGLEEMEGDGDGVVGDEQDETVPVKPVQTAENEDTGPIAVTVEDEVPVPAKVKEPKQPSAE